MNFKFILLVLKIQYLFMPKEWLVNKHYITSDKKPTTNDVLEEILTLMGWHNLNQGEMLINGLMKLFFKFNAYMTVIFCYINKAINKL